MESGRPAPKETLVAMTLTYTLDQDRLTDAERRRDDRVEAWTAVRVYEPFSSRTVGGLTLNVSPGGMCVRLDASLALRPGRFLSLRSAASQADAIDPLARVRPARVVWVRPDPEQDGMQLVGVQLYAAAQAAAA